MRVDLECLYCGRKWQAEARQQSQIEAMKCKCGDSSLKVKDAAKSKIDYYQGCPPFPEKKEMDGDIRYELYDYMGASD